jgi:hypothetical protein
MVRQAELQVRTEGFGGKILGASTKKWSQLQLWKAMKRIVLLKTPTYDDVLFTAFSGDGEALKALVKSNILSIQQVNGVKTVTAFSPLLYTAFEKIVSQAPQLRKGLDLIEKKADINKDMEELVKVEEELIKLKDGESKQDKSAAAIKQRRELLFDKLIYLNTKLEKKEKEARTIENS